jgi:hypothetical protein
VFADQCDNLIGTVWASSSPIELEKYQDSNAPKKSINIIFSVVSRRNSGTYVASINSQLADAWCSFINGAYHVTVRSTTTFSGTYNEIDATSDSANKPTQFTSSEILWSFDDNQYITYDRNSFQLP